MTVLYCAETDLKEYLLQAYLDKIEEINAGTVSRTIESVSEEIREAVVQGGHAIPETGSSAILKRICAVITAYRCVGDITSLMDTEAASNNEWIPLQRLFDQAQKDLDRIRKGELMPWPDADPGTISVVAPDAQFTDDLWRLY